MINEPLAQYNLSLTSDNLTFTLTATVGSGNDIDKYVYTKTGFPFEVGNFYAITVKMAPEGAVRGLFTVNSDGKKVYFSQGNLQATWDGSAAWTWHFAEHQWDIIGGKNGSTTNVAATGNNYINGNGTMSQAGTVDLFGWVGASSTTGTGVAQYGICNGSNADYGNVADEALKSDWGNTIGAGWCTLTSDEWVYLFNERQGGTVGTKENARYAFGTINATSLAYQNIGGKGGIILFPDGVTIAENEVYQAKGINSATSFDQDGSSFLCTPAQWAALEAKGCVFLPLTGYRSQDVVYDLYPIQYSPNILGYYWSSSSDKNNAEKARCLIFRSKYLSLPLSEESDKGTDNRRGGRSVRLVHVVASNN